LEKTIKAFQSTTPVAACLVAQMSFPTQKPRQSGATEKRFREQFASFHIIHASHRVFPASHNRRSPRLLEHCSPKMHFEIESRFKRLADASLHD
jgi:hypothetical protein